MNVPLEFSVKLFASGLIEPRLIRVAPNGDIFIAESAAGQIRVLRPSGAGDEVTRNEVFASGLRLPFGIAFYPHGNDPQWVYVANTDSVVRFHYSNGDLRADEQPEVIVPSLPQGGHWTRDIAFSLGLGFNPVSNDLLVLDFGNGNVLKVDPKTGASSVFVGPIADSGLNALTFDKAGNVYVSIPSTASSGGPIKMAAA